MMCVRFAEKKVIRWFRDLGRLSIPQYFLVQLILKNKTDSAALSAANSKTRIFSIMESQAATFCNCATPFASNKLCRLHGAWEVRDRIVSGKHTQTEQNGESEKRNTCVNSIDKFSLK